MTDVMIRINKLLMKCWKRKEFTFELAEALKGFAGKIAGNYAKSCKLHKKEDLENEVLIAAWNCVKDYRLICPNCGNRYASRSGYYKHVRQYEEVPPKPKMAITSYLYYRVKARMFVVKNSEKAQFRKPKDAKIHSLNNGNEEVSYLNFVGIKDKSYDQIDLIDLIERTMKCFSIMEKAIIRAIIQGCKTTNEVAKDIRKKFNLHNKGVSVVRHYVKKTLEKFDYSFDNSLLLAG